MMKKMTFALTCLLALGAADLPAAGAGLDGTQWDMHFQLADSILPFWTPDTIKFENGEFASVDFTPYGFTAAPYDFQKIETSLLWSAIQTNEKGEQTAWTGVWSGRSEARMEGTIVWSKPNGKVKHYRWNARVKAADEEQVSRK